MVDNEEIEVIVEKENVKLFSKRLKRGLRFSQTHNVRIFKNRKKALKFIKLQRMKKRDVIATDLKRNKSL